MKKIITIAILLAGTVSFAQDLDKKFNFMVFTEPNAWGDGINFGSDVEYEMKTFFVRTGFFLFPELNNVGYAQIHFSVGATLYRPKHTNHRVYIGIIGGTNFREGNPNPIAGAEIGSHIYISKTFFLRLNLSYLKRGDAGFYDGPDWVCNGDFGIGFKF